MLALASSASPAAAVSSTATLISGPSPFAACTVSFGTGGTLYPNAEVEPYVAVNPANSSNLIGVWQQDRWSDGGARGLVAGYSFNGGKTWGETPLPFSACSGANNYDRASDPWVSIGPDGTAYAIAIAFNVLNNLNGVLTSVSHDGGITWSRPVTLISDGPSFQFFSDKESITADPVHPGLAYAVWDRLAAPNSNPYANRHAAAYSGPTYFSMTRNGGQTWSTPQVIVKFTASNQQTIANQILVDPRSGTLYDFFNYIVPPQNVGGYNLAFVKSSDGGSTWSSPKIFASLQTVFVNDPNTGARIRTGDIIPEVAINPQNGQLYAVWQDSRFNGGHYDEIAFSTSSNGGASWSAPLRVNTPSGRPAFTPQVSVNANGVVGVTYYDFRSLQAGNLTSLPTDVWFVSSADGGQTFGNEAHLAGPFDMLQAPYAGGFFVGDYQGLVPQGLAFQAFYVRGNTGNPANPTDVFSAVITP